MFVKIPVYRQLTWQDMATQFYMSEKQAKKIADSEHVFFYEHVTKILLEHQEIFAPLYEDKSTGRPAVSPAIIMASFIYADRFLIPDRQLIDALWTNNDLRRALGIEGYGPCVHVKPWCRETHVSFRKRLADYLEETGIDLAKEAVKILNAEYEKAMNMTYNTLRSDSTLIHANIKVESREELLFDAIRLFARDLVRLFPAETLTHWGLDVEMLEKFFKNKTLRNQLTYYANMTRPEVRQLYIDTFIEFVNVAESPDFKDCTILEMPSFKLMVKVFKQQCYRVDNPDGSLGIVMAKPGSGILRPTNIQSLYDLDCAFRQKGDVIIRGYVFNTVEAIDLGRSLIVDWALHPATKGDIDMLREYVELLPDVSVLVPEESYRRIIVDGAYYSEELRKLCLRKGYKLIATDLTGSPGNPFLGQFEYSEEAQEIQFCPAGSKPDHCNPVNKQGQMKAYMDQATCDNCPHRAECCASKTGIVTLTPSQINRGKIEVYYGTEEGKAARNVRSGIEGVQSNVKNRYLRDRMKYKCLSKNRTDMACVVGNMNLTKLWEFEHGTGRYVHNDTLTA